MVLSVVRWRGLAAFQRFVVNPENPGEIRRQFILEYDFLVADKRDHQVRHEGSTIINAVARVRRLAQEIRRIADLPAQPGGKVDVLRAGLPLPRRVRWLSYYVG